MKTPTDFRCDERGATAMEYALIATLVSLALIAGAEAMGLELATKFSSMVGFFRTA